MKATLRRCGRIDALKRIIAVALTTLLVACAGLQFDPLEGFVPTDAGRKPDFEAIAEYAAYAQAAYFSEDEIRNRYPATVRINAPRGTKTRYFLTVEPADRRQTISVRGTKTFNDVLHDIEFAIVEDAGLQLPLHKGFEADARLIYADVKPYLKRDYRTRVTGHSLGAAVSAILMIYLQRDGFTVERSINFGQPKFTNVAGAERYEALPLQRIVDRDDVVPMLPPLLSRHPKHGAYAHVGEEVVLLDGPEFLQLDDHDSARISVDEFWRQRKFASKDDHRMQQYLARIEPKRSRSNRVDYSAWRRRRGQ